MLTHVPNSTRTVVVLASLAGCAFLPGSGSLPRQVDLDVLNAASVPICQISTSLDGTAWQKTTRFDSEIVEPGGRRKIYFPQPADLQDASTFVSYRVRFFACNEPRRAGDEGPLLADKTVTPPRDRTVAVP